MHDARDITTQLTAALRASVNGDGGWGYFQGKTSRIEPSCWAALALLDGALSSDERTLADGALSLLARWQRPDGLLVDVLGAPPNLAFNGLAAVVFERALAKRVIGLYQYRQAIDSLVGGIMASEGTRFPELDVARQNNRLFAWPWMEGTFSWIEPTCWCLLAIKKAAPASRLAAIPFRVAEAERMLANRCCVTGGWNYGSSNVLGKELVPYVTTSAVALLALRDRRALVEVARSVAWLTANWQREPSALALSLTLIAMRLYRQPAENVDRALYAHLAAAGLAENIATRATALYALTGAVHGFAALAV